MTTGTVEQVPATATMATILSAIVKITKITTDEEYLAVADARKSALAAIKEIKAELDPIVAAANAAHKLATAKRNEYVQPFDGVVERAKSLMNNYDTMKRDEARREAQEAQRQADEAAAAARKAEADRLIELAAAAEKAGLGDKAVVLAAAAEQVEAAVPPYTPPPAPVVTTPEIKGLSYRDVIRFEIVNRALVPDEFKTINEAAIGQRVRALGMATVIPGVRVFTTRESVQRQ